LKGNRKGFIRKYHERLRTPVCPSAQVQCVSTKRPISTILNSYYVCYYLRWIHNNSSFQKSRMNMKSEISLNVPAQRSNNLLQKKKWPQSWAFFFVQVVVGCSASVLQLSFELGFKISRLKLSFFGSKWISWISSTALCVSQKKSHLPQSILNVFLITLKSNWSHVPKFKEWHSIRKCIDDISVNSKIINSRENNSCGWDFSNLKKIVRMLLQGRHLR
jgi:hypothetical protein